MIPLLRAVIRGFGYAFRGIFRTLREERNFRIHLVAVAITSWFSVLYGISAGQAAILLIFFVLVLSLELVNTAVERSVDLISPQLSDLAGKAKDAAAGAVLVAAIGAVICAVIFFRDPVRWAAVGDKLSSPVRLTCLFVFFVISFLFVKWPFASGKNRIKK